MLSDMLHHMRTQFALESDHFFPKLRAEQPELALDIDALISEHSELLSALESIVQLADCGYTDRVTWLTIDAQFQSFTWSLASHGSRKRLIIEEAESDDTAPSTLCST
jgi:hypothetical protein